jgi:hypothetical protein
VLAGFHQIGEILISVNRFGIELFSYRFAPTLPVPYQLDRAETAGHFTEFPDPVMYTGATIELHPL